MIINKKRLKKNSYEREGFSQMIINKKKIKKILMKGKDFQG